METNDFFNQIFGGFKLKETKKEVTEKYIKGIINKEEFIRRMKNAE